MPQSKTPQISPPALADNAIAKNALDALEQIDREAKQKKLGQLESLQQARDDILEQMQQLQHQMSHIESAIAAISGKPVPSKERKPRRDLEEVRVRVGRWMVGRQGQKFMAGDLAREFPELDGVPVSIFMKPLVAEGKVVMDASGGNRQVKYFVAEG
jgi:hypothetical protein